MFLTCSHSLTDRTQDSGSCNRGSIPRGSKSETLKFTIAKYKGLYLDAMLGTIAVMTRLYVRNRLFAEPSFVEGMARVLDIGATLQVYNTSLTGREADVKALKNDWRAVGDDLKAAIEHEQQIVRAK